MKERPILFSGPMVRAILDGTKSQTRRVVRPQPPAGWHRPCVGDDGVASGYCDSDPTNERRCPYGAPGERLYVKETCWIWGRWTLNGVTTTGRQRWRFRAEPEHRVRFDRPEQTARRESPQPGFDGLPGWVYRHARFMPRWASRITLEITDVRVERLQDISEEDAKAEGTEPFRLPVHPARESLRHVDGYSQLWDSINGEGSWDLNPWVWALTFRRVHG